MQQDPSNLESREAEAKPYRGGPRTPAGRARSSLNGLKHGLCARTVLLPNDDPAVYLAFSQQILDYWNPANAMERMLAQWIADDCWRLERGKTHEQAFMALGHAEQSGLVSCDDPETHAAVTEAATFRANPQAFGNLSLYQQRITREIHKNMKLLQEMQKERKAAAQAAMEEAVLLHNYYKMLKEPFDPKEFQFVYSSEEIAREAVRRTRLEEAKVAQKLRYKLSEFRSWRQKYGQKSLEVPAA